MDRRTFLGTALVGSAAFALSAKMGTAAGFEVTRTDAEWRAMLSKIEYKVMRKEGTERAGSSPLGQELCRRHLSLPGVRSGALFLEGQV